MSVDDRDSDQSSITRATTAATWSRPVRLPKSSSMTSATMSAHTTGLASRNESSEKAAMPAMLPAMSSR